MMKTFSLLRSLSLAIVLLAGGLISCSDDDPAQPAPTPSGEPIAQPVLASSHITQSGFVVSWAAIDNARVYGYIIDPVSDQDEMKYTMNTAVEFSGLTPGSTHTVHVQAVPAADDTAHARSEIARITVTTEAEDPDFFSFEQEWITSVGAGIRIIPSDPDAIYIHINPSKNQLEYINDIDAYINAYIAENFWYGEGQWVPTNYGVFQGESVYEEFVTLDPETTYILMPVVVSSQGRPIKYGQYEYTTPAISDVDCTFTIDFGPISYDLVTFTITPSDLYTQWTCDCVVSANYAGMTDEEIVNTMMQNGSLYSEHGVKESRYSLTYPDTDYTIYVVGVMQQIPTTPLYKFNFHSAGKDYTFESDAYTEVSEIVAITEATADWASGYTTIVAILQPNEHTNNYWAICGAASRFEGLSDRELAELCEAGGVEAEGQWHIDGYYAWDANTQVPVNGEGMIVVLSRDVYGKSGRITKYRFTATPFGEVEDPEPPIIG